MAQANATSRQAFLPPSVAIALACVAGMGLGVSGCGSNAQQDVPGTEYPIAERRAPAIDDHNPPVLTTRQRMGLEAPARGGVPVPTEAPSATPDAAPATPASTNVPTAVAGSGVTWTTPEGWDELPPTAMRAGNFRVGGDANAECSLTILPGSAGGLLANVNRWRAQLGEAPIEAEQLASLDRIPMLGGEAVLVQVTGTYTGMRGQTNIPDAMLIGAALETASQTYFVKMTGPRSVLESQADALVAFCASIRVAGDVPEPAQVAAVRTAEPVAPTSEAPAFDPGSLSWTAPAGWDQAPPRTMREVTFTNGKTELYVTVLVGDGGGLGANVNRWIGQMGQPTLAPGDIEALPRLAMLGVDAVLVDATGAFTGMRGETKPDYGLLGAIALLESHSVFVKMTGPAAEVAALEDAFVAFCTSLKSGTTAPETEAPPRVASASPPETEAPPRIASASPPETEASVPQADHVRHRHAFDALRVAWSLPKAWVEGGRLGRIVWFENGPARLYLTLRDAEDESMLAAVNRYRSMAGAADQDAAAIEALPRIPMLGGTGVLIDARGEGRALLGAVSRVDAGVFGVSIRGPVAAVQEHLDVLFDLCAGMQVEQ